MAGVIQDIALRRSRRNLGEDPARHVRRLGVAVAMLVAVVIIGTVGFILIEQMSPLDGFYMTIITLSTVGYGEVKPLHPLGKALAMFIIIYGVGVGAYAATALGQMVVEGQFKEMFGRKKMNTKIGNLSNHFIIAGFGRVGQHVAQEFSRRGVSFVVIERDESPLKHLISHGYLFVEGEATTDETLLEAGIDRARTLVSTLPDEAQNVYLTLSARDMNKNLSIIARADFDGGEKKLLRAGASHVVSPHVIGGQRMAMASLRPNVVDFMHMTSMGKDGLSIEEIVIPVGSPLSGKTLIESNLKESYGVTIIGIRRPSGKFDIAPGPQTTLAETDTMVVIGPNEGLERLGKELNHRQG